MNEYPDQAAAERIRHGFTYGFSIHYSGPLKDFEAKNLKSAEAHPQVVRDKIKKEVAEGRVEGPFSDPPFEGFRVSPLGLVPKREPGQFRMIHHLSFPKGDSVNDHIDPELCSVQYTKFDAAVAMVQRLGKGTRLAKADIKSAFRLLCVSRECFQVLGFKFEGAYYFDKVLPFGCSISCSIFEQFARFLEWCIRSSCSVGEIEHYLDDFLFGGREGSEDCQSMLQTFLDRCREFGVPIADEKTEGPTTSLVFLGLLIDSELMLIRIPRDKIALLISQIRDILGHKRSVTLKELQSVLGSLNFMCRAITPGRPFCRRLVDATCGVPSPHHHIRINPGMRQDLKMWLKFFQDFNGVSVFQDAEWLTNTDLLLYTDSSAAEGNGFGAYFQGHWTQGAWPKAWVLEGITKDINVLEFFPILVAVYIWGDRLRNKKVLFRCDNLSVVHVLNKQSSKSALLMVLVRALTLRCLNLNLMFRAEHIPGVENGIADSLSRFQMERFRQLAPEAQARPVVFPSRLWNIFRLEPESY